MLSFNIMIKATAITALTNEEVGDVQIQTFSIPTQKHLKIL